MLAEDSRNVAGRNMCKRESEKFGAADCDRKVRHGVGAEKDDVLVYRDIANKFGSERDSEVSANGIRRPRIEELERNPTGSIQPGGASNYKVCQTGLLSGNRHQLNLASPGNLVALSPRDVTRLSRGELFCYDRKP
jgi:hypothetical protein